MKVIQSPLFARNVKKLHNDQKLILDDKIRMILADPGIGNEKKGDLRGIFVYKFKIKTDPYLLAYRIKENILELITLGSHENYYRNLKKYVKIK
jgi:mRNA-degrading endonuclease RelE of RelBE toxin-antitoxin system